jgi:hypothetical protein
MMHLDSGKIAALLDGSLTPGEARTLADHLDGECEQCEALLSEQIDVYGLDGLADALIATALPPASGGGNDLEFARITRALHERRPAPRRFLPAAIAASLLVAGVAGMVAHELGAPGAGVAGWDGLKGFAPRAIPVRLRFLELGQDGRIEKGISGEPVDSGSSLLFEVEAARAAHLALARVSPGGTELIWHRRVDGGRTQVAVDGRPAAYPLTGLSGVQRFVLVASEANLDDLRVEQAARALAPPAGISVDASELDGLSLDVIELFVR